MGGRTLGTPPSTPFLPKCPWFVVPRQIGPLSPDHSTIALGRKSHQLQRTAPPTPRPLPQTCRRAPTPAASGGTRPAILPRRARRWRTTAAPGGARHPHRTGGPILPHSASTLTPGKALHLPRANCGTRRLLVQRGLNAGGRLRRWSSARRRSRKPINKQVAGRPRPYSTLRTSASGAPSVTRPRAPLSRSSCGPGTRARRAQRSRSRPRSRGRANGSTSPTRSACAATALASGDSRRKPARWCDASSRS